MKNILISIIAVGVMTILSACSSTNRASLGAGATPGKDYITDLRPSAAARQYFSKIGNPSPIETITRGSSAKSKTGVRYVANDGILIPAGVTVSFHNKGYCMDPKLPAPVADEEYQLVPISALIPTELQGIYHTLLKREAAGDSAVKSNMQGLIWSLRTAGVEGGYASRMSDTQKRIFNSCTSRPGEFERIHNSGLATNKLVNKLWSLADSAGSVRFNGRTLRASNFRSAGAINNVINSQLDSLISMGKKLPIQRTGFNYGELQPGIYTDIRGNGHLAFVAKIANTTNNDFIFYPYNYAAQVGSGSALTSLSSNVQRQRVSLGSIMFMNVLHQLKKEKDDEPLLKGIPFHKQSCAERRKQIEMAALAAAVYKDPNFSLPEQILADAGYELALYTEKEDLISISPHYASGLYINKKKKSVSLVFRGTANLGDALDDIGIYIDATTPTTKKNAEDYDRFKEVRKMANYVEKVFPGYEITIVGHSLGGAMVQHAMNCISDPKVKAYTFNSYALPEWFDVRFDPRITDIANGDEVVNKMLSFSRVYGRRVVVDKIDRPTTSNVIDRVYNFKNKMGDQHSIMTTLINMLHGARNCK